MVQMLLTDQRTDVNLRSEYTVKHVFGSQFSRTIEFKRSPLDSSIVSGNIDIMSLLMKMPNIDVNSPYEWKQQYDHFENSNEEESNPLIHAIQKKNAKILKI